MGDATLLEHNPLLEILTPSLFEYANKITFPWPLSQPLNGGEVGQTFFGHQDNAAADWADPEIKSALESLSKVGLENIKTSDLMDLLPSASEPKFLHQVTGLILVLDQGPRYLCKGVNGRYIYQYFDVLSRQLCGFLLGLKEEENPFNLGTWRKAGVREDQAIVRISMIIAPVVHSETLPDQALHLALTEKLRISWEDYSGTKDPYRETFEADLKDEWLFARWLGAGPRMDEDVEMSAFVFWIMRYFTAHAPFLRRFGRSPWRNVSVGREDTEGEAKWLRICGPQCGREIGGEDEWVRREVGKDVETGVWRPLELSFHNII